MLKVTYHVQGTFSLKNYADGHLSARSYPYATNSCIRGAILASMIQRKGKEYANDHFYRLKETLLFVQVPERYAVEQKRFRMLSNKAVTNRPVPSTIAETMSIVTVGMREVVKTSNVVFYIDETLEDIVEFLENIKVLGNSESLVSLESIERVSEMENVLLESQRVDYRNPAPLMENMDWTVIRKEMKKGLGPDKGLSFTDIYAYSGKNHNKYRKMRCEVVEKMAC